MVKRNPFPVSQEEIEAFVAENEVVKSYLSKFHRATRKGQRGTYEIYSDILCRFFKWLHLEKKWKASPSELLDDQLRRRGSRSVEERQRHINLVLEFTRDNKDPYFRKLSDGRKYMMYICIKGFYEYHEVPLTTAKGKYGKHKKRKNHPKQITLAEAKKLLGWLPQREKTILLIILQSGLEVGATPEVHWRESFRESSIKARSKEFIKEGFIGRS